MDKKTARTQRFLNLMLVLKNLSGTDIDLIISEAESRYYGRYAKLLSPESVRKILREYIISTEEFKIISGARILQPEEMEGYRNNIGHMDETQKYLFEKQKYNMPEIIDENNQGYRK
jgi:hypothetical protein